MLLKGYAKPFAHWGVPMNARLQLLLVIGIVLLLIYFTVSNIGAPIDTSGMRGR